MPTHGGAADGELVTELSRGKLSLAQPLQDATPGRIGESSERVHRRCVTYALRNSQVTDVGQTSVSNDTVCGHARRGREPQTGVVRVATFNILHGLSLADGRVDVSRLAAAVGVLDVDVLAMQEVDRNQQRSLGADLTAVAAEALGATEYRFVPALTGTPGGAWQAASHNDPKSAAGYGIALLSRYRVSDWQVIRLPGSPLPAPIPSAGRVPVRLVRDEPRVAVGALVHPPEGAVRVVTTHLTYLPGWNVYQLRRLRQELDSGDEPLLLLGDLNMGPSVAGAATGLRALATHPTFPSYAPRRQLDHILARGLGAHAPAEAIPLPLSDHQALTVEVCLNSHCSTHRS